MVSITVEHPDYRPGRGEKQLDRGLVLYDEAAQAFQVWAAIYGGRCDGNDGYERVDRDAVTKVIESGTVLGELVKLAVADAETRTLTDSVARRPERFAVATALIARRAELTTTPKTTEATCSHGAPFTADCTDCEW
jgi:hypothetical protein